MAEDPLESGTGPPDGRVGASAGESFFSDGGFDELRQAVSSYSVELTEESRRVAERMLADRASKDHVTIADQNLRSGYAGRRAEAWTALGGACFGAGVSAYGGMLGTGEYPPGVVFLALFLMVSGAAVLASRLAR